MVVHGDRNRDDTPVVRRPHTTATWFLVEDGTFKCSWEPTKQKVRNLVRDPRCTVMLLARIPYSAALAVLARTGERVASRRLGLTAER